MILRRLLSIILVSALLFSSMLAASVRASRSSQDDPISLRARQLLEKMTPEERVGQLFLVSFTGPAAEAGSQIYDLITQYHVGGVMLSAANDNFAAAPDTVAAAYDLIAQLQNVDWQTSQAPGQALETVTPGGAPTDTPAATPTLAASSTPAIPANYVPLFIGVSQNGDGYPNDQILSGLTPLPNLMALGAAWNPDLAEQVGAVAGQELSAIGFNFYLGPALDVLESPEANLGNGLDAGAFGGDPYWVGAMGSAYITGLHTGSSGQLVVVASHFPGRGSSDRPEGQEPATVRKSLEQLKQIELAPYFTVTGNAQTLQGTTDGLLVSHIRYQGFQGNIRSTTRPVSFDPQALSQILSLPTFASWRQAGGLIVSDDLGSQTVRSFYDPGGQTFQSRLVARDAFLAGNDLLYMGNIQSSDAPDNYTSVAKAIEFFIQKYQDDPAFAQRVDDAAMRLLTIKIGLYPNFDPSHVVPAKDGLSNLNQSQAVTFEVARQAATLVSPDIQDLESVLPSPPVVTDRIVFLTDTRSGRQCSACPDEPMLAVDALQNAILRLYGPQAGGQVLSARLASYSFDVLAGILESGSGNLDLESSLRQASWVIINMLDAEPGQAQTTVLRRFLSERQDLLRNKRVVVFSFNAPYFLDATDISKLTAYYCLYSKSAPFVEVAARLLFRELSPAGILPVSVSGIGYDLLTATSPDPDQVISLSLDLPPAPAPNGTQTPEPTSTPSFRVGDTVSVRTGVILDRNGHPVPDGTGVRFQVAMSGEGGVVQQMDTVTAQGVAKVSFSIARPGLLEVSATSEPANTSVTLQLNISSEGFSLTVVAPTEENQATPTPQVAVTPGVEPSTPLQNGYPGFGGWLVMVILLGGFGCLAYWLGDRFASRHWAVRWTACAALGGLLAYTYLAVRLPGAAIYLQRNGWFGMIGIILIGGTAGLAGAYTWFRLVRVSRKRSD